MVDYEMTGAIAKKIKAIRLKQGITLNDLSKRTILSKGLLSKIENARTIPSLPVFMSLAKALGTSPKDFFEETTLANGKGYLHFKHSDYLSVRKEDRPGFDYDFIFSQMMPGSALQAYVLTVHPKAMQQPTTTDGFELKYILHGRCEYHLGDDVLQLEKGDTLYFDASKPHMPVNTGKGKVIMLVLYFLEIK